MTKQTFTLYFMIKKLSASISCPILWSHSTPDLCLSIRSWFAATLFILSWSPNCLPIPALPWFPLGTPSRPVASRKLKLPTNRSMQAESDSSSLVWSLPSSQLMSLLWQWYWLCQGFRNCCFRISKSCIENSVSIRCNGVFASTAGMY